MRSQLNTDRPGGLTSSFTPVGPTRMSISNVTSSPVRTHSGGEDHCASAFIMWAISANLTDRTPQLAFPFPPMWAISANLIDRMPQLASLPPVWAISANLIDRTP